MERTVSEKSMKVQYCINHYCPARYDSFDYSAKQMPMIIPEFGRYSVHAMTYFAF